MEIKIFGGIRQVFAFEVVLDFLLEFAINFFPINIFVCSICTSYYSSFLGKSARECVTSHFFTVPAPKGLRSHSLLQQDENKTSIR